MCRTGKTAASGAARAVRRRDRAERFSASTVEVRFADLPAGAWRPSRARVAAVLRAMIRAAGAAPAGLSVLLTGDTAIRALNRRFRRIDRPTDVLSFASPGPQRPRGSGPVELGDVVVSLPTCRGRARALRCPAFDHLAHLLAHGLLHLLGLDHRTLREFEAMERRTRNLLESAAGLGA